jgi:hypothetical protein
MSHSKNVQFNETQPLHLTISKISKAMGRIRTRHSARQDLLNDLLLILTAQIGLVAHEVIFISQEEKENKWFRSRR